jgi:N utilization substance protein B
MLNRRHLRIKVLQALYAFYQTENKDVYAGEKELLKAIERIYDLYLYLFLTFPELKAKGEFRLAENKKKLLPSEEDLNPNRKFVDNAIIKIIENHIDLRTEAENRRINWIGAKEQEIFRKMYLEIRESEVYFQFMNNGETGFEEDKQFAIQLFKTEIANFEPLYDYFEEKSVHWLDDIDLACSMVIKTIKTFSDDEEARNAILPLYKVDDDEKEFIQQLFRKTIQMEQENVQLIDELTANWEIDRIAKMDIILMKMALTEMKVFSNIPIKVTLNEYIEISKFYSTPKSNIFINGVLDKAIERLKRENKIVKVGRGLMN